jgi:hypothetical protein
MGYYTYYTLEIMTADDLRSHDSSLEIIAKLRRDNEYARSAFDHEGRTNTETTWYDSQDEMKEFSKAFPDALFVLTGDGEGNDDRWCAYFRDGKMQFAPGRIDYDEFDENKL